MQVPGSSHNGVVFAAVTGYTAAVTHYTRRVRGYTRIFDGCIVTKWEQRVWDVVELNTSHFSSIINVYITDHNTTRLALS